MLKDLDPVLHQQLRLGIISLLISVKEAEFSFLKEKTNATSGNLSVQLNRLADAGYITIAKSFRDKYPLTTCRITRQGVVAFESYVDALKNYIETK